MKASIYEPAEDSYLLAKELKKRKCKRFLDMGCGTGIQSENIRAEEIVCVDINKDALEYAKKKLRGNIRFIESNLFANVEGKFDLIAFNTPYLDDEEPQDYAWTYMQNGRDIIEEFIVKAKKYLTDNGKILIVISDRDFDKYRNIAKKEGYVWRVLKEKPLFFEKLYLIELEVKT